MEYEIITNWCVIKVCFNKCQARFGWLSDFCSELVRPVDDSVVKRQLRELVLLSSQNSISQNGESSQLL